LGAEAEFFIHSFVIGAGHERHADFKDNRAWISGGISFTKCLAADAVGPTGALFKHGGIPCKVVMDHVTAVAVEINALLANLSTDQDLW